MSKNISKVYLSSDSEKILSIGKKNKVAIIKRPKKISGDKAKSEEAVLHVLNNINYTPDAVVMLEPTAPLREPWDIDLGVEIAAMLSFSAIKNNDKVGLALFSDKVEKYIPPKKGKKHVLRLITDIINHDFENSNKRTSIKSAIDFANKISKRKSVIFLISDFIDDNFWNELKFLNFKHDVVGLQIYDTNERSFPNIGLINIHDSETGKTTWIDTSVKKNRNKFERNSNEKLNEFSKKCKNIGFDLLQINTDDDYIKFLMQFFRSRAKRS